MKEGKCALLVDESISTLKCPDCSLSFSYLLSGAKKSFKLAFTPPPPFIFLEVSSLSLSLSLSLSSPFHFFFIPQCQGFHTENTSKQIFIVPGLFSFTRITWSSFCCFFLHLKHDNRYFHAQLLHITDITRCRSPPRPTRFRQKNPASMSPGKANNQAGGKQVTMKRQCQTSSKHNNRHMHVTHRHHVQ